MRRTGFLGLSLFLLCAVVVSTLPAFGQEKQPQAKTKPEYDAYLALYNEKDPAKKAPLGEKFITDFKESDFIPNAYTMTIKAYSDSKNWAKVMETADRAVGIPGDDNKWKAYAFEYSMIAGQNANNVDKIISYGDKLLETDPANLNAMITVSAVIPAKLPADEAGKKAALDKASQLASKALEGV